MMGKDKLVTTSTLNRVEVIDSSGRAYLKWLEKPMKVELSLQDDDRTLKIFIYDEKTDIGDTTKGTE